MCLCAPAVKKGPLMDTGPVGIRLGYSQLGLDRFCPHNSSPKCRVCRQWQSLMHIWEKSDIHAGSPRGILPGHNISFGPLPKEVGEKQSDRVGEGQNARKVSGACYWASQYRAQVYPPARPCFPVDQSLFSFAMKLAGITWKLLVMFLTLRPDAIYLLALEE